MIKADLAWLKQVLIDDTVETVNFSDEILNLTVNYVSTDSRTITHGEVFVALKGPHFDGTKFVADVQSKGAIAAVVESFVDVDLPQIKVPNALKAYGKIASNVAKQANVKTIAVTGSVGKTSVKEMCAAILSQCGKVLATEGNFNNEVGVPHTLMRFQPDYDFAVVELGANHIGEIAYTTELTRPDVAILNNVAEAHLEGFGDIFGVVRAKGEIFNSLTDKGVAIVNGDSPYKDYWLTHLEQKLPSEQIIQFSIEQNHDNWIWADNIHLNDQGCACFDMNYNGTVTAIELVVPGRHNVANALAAAVACLKLGANINDVIAGLNSAQGAKGRVNLLNVSDSIRLIDDSYNANVQSVKAAADLLVSYQHNSILVLGDMGELGTDARRYHQEVGEYAKAAGVKKLYSFGVLSQSASDVFAQDGCHFSNQSQLIESLTSLLHNTTDKTTILVKGSRSAKMENVVNALISKTQNKNNKGEHTC